MTALQAAQPNPLRGKQSLSSAPHPLADAAAAGGAGSRSQTPLPARLGLGAMLMLPAGAIAWPVHERKASRAPSPAAAASTAAGLEGSNSVSDGGAAAEPAPGGLVHVAWDIENCHLGHFHGEPQGSKPDDGRVVIADLLAALKAPI